MGIDELNFNYYSITNDRKLLWIVLGHGIELGITWY